jgi:hypothetical protein
MKQKKFCLKKFAEIADSKKLIFSKSPVLKMLLQKFQRLVLGLVELIDANFFLPHETLSKVLEYEG